MSNELMLVESKTMREEIVGKVSDERVDEIFNKVKGTYFASRWDKRNNGNGGELL